MNRTDILSYPTADCVLSVNIIDELSLKMLAIVLLHEYFGHSD